jgi:hypothetical protein
MMVMCGQSNQIWHYFAGKYPGSVGYLFGPKNMAKQALVDWMPFACDNDAFSAWVNKTQWDESAWFDMLKRVKRSGLSPMWVLVPDVVADKDATLAKWKTYSPVVKNYGWPTAFAVQDGMVPSDVPDADVIFVGGTTAWKWTTMPMWAKSFPRVHVGRVNEMRRVWSCEDNGIESVDGSGWFRDTSNGRRINSLRLWFDGKRLDTMELPL